MPNKKHAKHNKRQSLPKANLPPGHVELAHVQTEVKQSEAHDNAATGKKEKQITAMRNTNGFVTWMQTWLPIIISALILIVVAVQAYIYRRQWEAMKNQGDLMAKQLKQSSGALKITERAWIFAEGTSFNYFKDANTIERAAVGVVFRNTGRTPAFNVELTDCVEVREVAPSIEQRNPAKCRTKQLGVIGPNTTFTVNNYSEEVVPRDSLEKVFYKPGRHLYYWGKITYKTFSDDIGWTSFCYVNADKQLAPCDEGNDADSPKNSGQENPN
jgi:hypothetical protein